MQLSVQWVFVRTEDQALRHPGSIHQQLSEPRAIRGPNLSGRLEQFQPWSRSSGFPLLFVVLRYFPVGPFG